MASLLRSLTHTQASLRLRPCPSGYSICAPLVQRAAKGCLTFLKQGAFFVQRFSFAHTAAESLMFLQPEALSRFSCLLAGMPFKISSVFASFYNIQAPVSSYHPAKVRSGPIIFFAIPAFPRRALVRGPLRALHFPCNIHECLACDKYDASKIGFGLAWQCGRTKHGRCAFYSTSISTSTSIATAASASTDFSSSHSD